MDTLRRTMIVTIETKGDNAWRMMEAIEEELLDACAIAARWPDRCTVDADLCVDALSQSLIDKLCNTTGVK